MQVAALAPKLEAMEAAWYRLHTISGADTPEEVIAYWEGAQRLCEHSLMQSPGFQAWRLPLGFAACRKLCHATEHG